MVHLYLVSERMGDWEAALIGYEAHQRAQHRAERTIESRRNLIRAIAHSSGKPLAAITETDLLARMGRKRADGRPIAASSMQRERSDMQSFFAWAKEYGHIAKNPARKLPKVTVPRGKPRPLTMEQVQAMLDCGIRSKTRTMILLAVYQGLRAHEIAKIHSDDIDVIAGTLRVVGKGAKDRTLPLHPLIRVEAARYNGQWFPSHGTNTKPYVHWRSVSDRMTQVIRRAGITDPKITGHSLRHTFGTELVAAGVDIRIAQELLRHESLNSTQIYTGVTFEQMRTSLAVLPLMRTVGKLAA